MIIVSGYTPNYEAEVRNLESSLKKFDLQFKLYPYESLGTWEKNCQYKARIIRQAMDEFPNDSIVWLDADAEVMKRPELFFQLKCDIAYHLLHGRELLSGTLYFANNPLAKKLVDEWIIAGAPGREWDQKVLQKVLTRVKGLTVVSLPFSYVKIVNQQAGIDPVILQRQASREHKDDNRQITSTTLYPGMRVLPDGTWTLLRSDRSIESKLDSQYVRRGRDRVWLPVHKDRKLFKDKHLGEILTIVGKGPSLDLINKSNFVPGPVIAVNEAVIAVERLRLENKLYGIQQDRRIGIQKVAPTTTLILGRLSHDLYPVAENVVKIWAEEYGGTLVTLTAILAIRIGLEMGCSQFRMLCFDGCMGGSLEYAKVVGKSPKAGGPVKRFVGHGDELRRELSNSAVEWVKPIASAASADISRR